MVKRIKTFKLFESGLKSMIDLGEIEDLIQSEIIDNYNCDIKVLGIGTEETIKTSSNLYYIKVRFPDRLDGMPFNFAHEYKFLSMSRDFSRSNLVESHKSISDKLEFLYIEIDFSFNDINSDIESFCGSMSNLYNRISKISGKQQDDVFHSDYEYNGIFVEESPYGVFRSIDVDWSLIISGEIEILLEEEADTISCVMILK
jgi:hypothetical protein